jgi:Na+-transporting NADH:ubiquinone oxidoreductase subunit C
VQHSVRYIVMFAAGVCVVCSIFVSSAAVLLKDRQEENKVFDRQMKVLTVAGLVEDGQKLTKDEAASRFEKNIKAEVVELKTGEVQDDINASEFDQQAAKGDPERSIQAPANDAKVQRLPKNAIVYKVTEGDSVTAYIFPVEGKGLWSTLYGYLALEKDLRTIKGITFYQHGETPGLGGEVDNPRWKALWVGRKAFDESGTPKIQVIKGQAGSAEEAPYSVDGLSGATLTSRGVTHLVRFWLGENGFGPYLKRQSSGGGDSQAQGPRQLRPRRRGSMGADKGIRRMPPRRPGPRNAPGARTPREGKGTK